MFMDAMNVLKGVRLGLTTKKVESALVHKKNMLAASMLQSKAVAQFMNSMSLDAPRISQVDDSHMLAIVDTSRPAQGREIVEAL